MKQRVAALIDVFKLFKMPIEIDTLEVWAKIAEDCAKVAILGIPVVVFSNAPYPFRGWSAIALIVSAYMSLCLGGVIRKTILKCRKEINDVT